MTHTIHRFGPLSLHQNTLILPHETHGLSSYQIHHRVGIGRLTLAEYPDLWAELIDAIAGDYVSASWATESSVNPSCEASALAALQD